ncbi:MAG: hypothetical protein OEO83_01585 [Alphaproteobacteria bacterium]|nr:hypothetical protein [Alphaproteobacteria bacterium]
MEIRVECYAGHRGEETPRRLHFDSRTVEVARVLDAWHGPDHRYFKLLGSDGATYLLRHDEPAGEWALVQFQRAERPGGHAEG